MGTTKDPEGFRRHSSGRRQVLGGRPLEETPKRGCGLGAALVGVGLVLAAAVWLLGSERGEAVARSPIAATPGARASEEPLELVAPVAAAEDGAPRAVVRTETSPFAPRAPRAWPRTQSGTAVASLSIQLLRGWTDTPLADAEVLWLGRGELERMRAAGLAVTTVEFEPVLRTHGRSARSNAEGRLTITADGCHLLVIQEEWTRELEVVPIAGEPTRVRVFAPRALDVEVVDVQGRAALGIGVEFWRVDALGVPQVQTYSTLTSRAVGGLILDDVDALLQPRLRSDAGRTVRLRDGKLVRGELPELEPTRLRVAITESLAPDVWQEIDLAVDPLPRVLLRLPPLGELRVLVADAEGRPVPWNGRVELFQDGDVGVPWTEELHAGVAEFHNLRLGRDMNVRAVRAEGNRGEMQRVEPFANGDLLREVVLTDVPVAPRLLVRPIHPDGHALPRTWVHVKLANFRRPMEDQLPQGVTGFIRGQIAGRSGGDGVAGETDELIFVDAAGNEITPKPAPERHWERSTLTHADGYAEFAMPDALLETRGAMLVVLLRHGGRDLQSEGVLVERGEVWGDLDLGNVLLQER